MTTITITALHGTGQQQEPFQVWVNLEKLSAYGEVLAQMLGFITGANAFVDVIGGNGADGVNSRLWVTQTVAEISQAIKDAV